MLEIPIIIYINAFLTGVFTKLGDIANDDGFKVSKKLNILFGVLWGVFGALVVVGNLYVGAFYFGILLSWIFRYKLDNYSHGIGASIILVAIFYTRPTSELQVLIAVVAFILFTVFGILSRRKIIKSGIFLNYNLYSFLFLIILSVIYPDIWIVVLASLSNVIGYHLIKKWWKRKLNTNQIYQH